MKFMLAAAGAPHDSLKGPKSQKGAHKFLPLGLLLLVLGSCGEEPLAWDPPEDTTESRDFGTGDKSTDTTWEEDLEYDDTDEDSEIASDATDTKIPTTSSDACPEDPDKTEPGICGCGESDDDDDGDKTVNCEDECPLDPQKTEPGECGCFVREGTCGKEPYIETTKKTYLVGEPIVVHFFNLSKDKKNWIGLFWPIAKGENALAWKYTDGRKDGTMIFGALPPGKYEARLFFNDSFKLEDKVAFEVKAF